MGLTVEIITSSAFIDLNSGNSSKLIGLYGDDFKALVTVENIKPADISNCLIYGVCGYIASMDAQRLLNKLFYHLFNMKHRLAVGLLGF